MPGKFHLRRWLGWRCWSDDFRGVVETGSRTRERAAVEMWMNKVGCSLCNYLAMQSNRRDLKSTTMKKPIILALFALLLPFFALAEEEPSSREALHLLSYNIRHGRGMDDKIDFDRIARVIADTKPDLVALQEVDRGVRRSGEVDTPELLGKKLGMHHAFGVVMPYQGGEYGLAILSKFPVVETRVHKLPDGAEPRVALEVEIDLPQTSGKASRISFVCVHFDYVRRDEARFAQASTLIEILRKRKHPVIVAGDYNDTRGSRTLDAFAAEFHIPDTAGPTFGSSNPQKEIDFITWRGLPERAELRVIDEKEASDHFPLTAVIELADEE